MTATANTSFTPAANTCVAPSSANFTGWLVSGTSDIKQPGTTFTWGYDEDKTFTALWSCYWNSDDNTCEQGYEITLTNSFCVNWDSPPIPTKLYTIHNVGVFRDMARTEKMEPQVNGTGGQYPVTMPLATFTVYRDTQTNRPTNPVTGVQYSVSFMNAVNPPMSYDGDISNISHGYITQSGIDSGKNFTQDYSWVLTGASFHSISLGSVPLISGYTGHWYDNVNGTGDALFSASSYSLLQNCSKTATYYAHWTPNTYDVVYNPGAHAASGSTAYTDTDGATYDSPYNTLSFAATPVSNNMSADTGYVFVGWTTNSTPTFTNGNLNNQYTGDTYWKRTSALSLYAAYDCDTANGYQWNTNHTACENLYTVTYNCGNNGSGNPVSQSVNPQTSTSVTFHNASVCTPNSGYEFWYWNCVSNVYNSVQTTMPGITRYISGDETCTAIYREPCPNSGRRVNLLTGLGGPSVTDTGISSAASHDVSFESNNLGTLTTEGMCAGNSGTQFWPGTPTGSGNYCWCHMTYFTPTGGTAVNLSSYSNPPSVLDGGIYSSSYVCIPIKVEIEFKANPGLS